MANDHTCIINTKHKDREIDQNKFLNLPNDYKMIKNRLKKLRQEPLTKDYEDSKQKTNTLI